MDDEVCTTHTHVARLRVMKTVSGRYRGIVHLHRIGEDPGFSEQHDTEGDFATNVAPCARRSSLVWASFAETSRGYHKTS
ncbi:hypothetical protein C3L29_033935 [Pseudomonas sp. MWU12-2534b]|nr:hypothetical protein C3L29_033935 [Pseudomonas sp. MWU12-2534b]